MSTKLYCQKCDQVYNAPQSCNLDYPRAPKTKTCTTCRVKLAELPKPGGRYTSARDMAKEMEGK